MQPTYLDKTSRALSVRYEAGSFIFVDTGGIVAIPGLIGVPGGNGCFAAGTDAVRCPVDLGDPGIVGMRFHIATGGGDDRIDLGAMPELPVAH